MGYRRVVRDEVCSVTQQVCSASQQVCSASQQVCSASNEVSSGSRAFIRRMNATLSGAVTTTFASDEPFFTTEQVTSVAEEIIGDAPVMFFCQRSTNKLKGRKKPMTHIRCVITAVQNSSGRVRDAL